MSGFQAACHVPARIRMHPAWWPDDHVSSVSIRPYDQRPPDTGGIHTASAGHAAVHDTEPEASAESFSDVDAGRSGQGRPRWWA